MKDEDEGIAFDTSQDDISAKDEKKKAKIISDTGDKNTLLKQSLEEARKTKVGNVVMVLFSFSCLQETRKQAQGAPSEKGKSQPKKLRLIDRILERSREADSSVSHNIQKSKDMMMNKNKFKLMDMSEELSISSIRDNADNPQTEHPSPV